MGAGERPSIEGMHVRTPRRNVPSPSSQSINFPELMQYMMMHSDEENHMEQRHHEEREELKDRRHREQEDTEERYRGQRKKGEDRREQRMMAMMQMFVTGVLEGRKKRKRGDGEGDDNSHGG